MSLKVQSLKGDNVVVVMVLYIYRGERWTPYAKVKEDGWEVV